MSSSGQIGRMSSTQHSPITIGREERKKRVMGGIDTYLDQL